MLDTGVVIAALDRRHAHHAQAAEALTEMIDAIARDAARHRAQNVSLADGFAIATAHARAASLASFDARVRRALPAARVPLAPALAAGS